MKLEFIAFLIDFYNKDIYLFMQCLVSATIQKRSAYVIILT